AEAEASAVKNNPLITIGKLRALVAHQYVREARSTLLPNAYLSVTAVDSNPGSRLAAGGLNSPILFPRAAAGATVGQLITDFGRSTSLLSSSASQAKAEDQNAIAAMAQIILAVDQIFYNVLETKALVGVAQQTVDSRQLLVDKIKALTDAKLKSELDLSFTRVDLARGKLLLLEAHNNYQTSLAALSAILGYADEQDFQLVEEPAAITAPALDVLPLIQQALHQRPEVAALQNEVEAAQEFSSAEHDLRRPTVSALGVVGEAPVRDNSSTRAPKPLTFRRRSIVKNYPTFATTSHVTCEFPGRIPTVLSSAFLSLSNSANKPASLLIWRNPATILVSARSSNSARPSSKKPRPTSPTPMPNTNIA
ncbi:MAG: hypothetical protein DMG55_10125, partial [Acidobacteria bacterium]